MNRIGVDIRLSDLGAVVSGVTIEDGLIMPREIYLSFLRHVFSKSSEPDWRYNESPEKTKIVIKDATSFNLEELNRVSPCITVARMPCSFSNMAIGDHGPFNLSQLNYDSGTDMLTGGLIVNVYSRNGYEAELIAWIIMVMTKIGQEELRKTIFHDFRPLTCSQQSRVGSQSEFIFVSISIQYSFTFEWAKNKIGTLFDGCVDMGGLTPTATGSSPGGS